MPTTLDCTPFTQAEAAECRALRDELLMGRDLAMDFTGKGAATEARRMVRDLSPLSPIGTPWPRAPAAPHLPGRQLNSEGELLLQ